MQSVLILGRQPALGLAELESLYGSEEVRPVGDTAALLDLEPSELDYKRLGGSVKAGKVLTILDTDQWRDIETYLIEKTPEHAAMLPDGKLTIGLSAYGFRITPSKLNATGLSIKKAIRKRSDRSVRLVPNSELALSSAQVFHNHLTGERAWELLIIKDGDKTILAQTTNVQDIDSYTIRDRSRPKRDTRVGMLPPKLAQIIINLAVGQELNGERRTANDEVAENSTFTILDPFCGTGVLVQESLLMGYSAFGSDLEQRMIDYSRVNVNEWFLNKVEPHLPGTVTLAVGDATNYTWGEQLYHNDGEPYFVPEKISAVASETYLGKPFTSRPDSATLAKTVSEVDLILKKFLKNIHPQIGTGTRLCLAVPAWQIRPGQFKHLPLIDQISDLGYNRVRFEHVRDDQLLYYREDQIVARELLVITRK